MPQSIRSNFHLKGTSRTSQSGEFKVLEETAQEAINNHQQIMRDLTRKCLSLDIEGIKEDLILFCIRLTKTITQIETLVNLGNRDQELNDCSAALALGDVGVRAIFFNISDSAIKELLPVTCITKKPPASIIKRIVRIINIIFVAAINAYDNAITEKSLAAEIIEISTLNATENAANAMMEEVENMLECKDTEQPSMETQFAKFKLWSQQQQDEGSSNYKATTPAVKDKRGAKKPTEKNGKSKKSASIKKKKGKEAKNNNGGGNKGRDTESANAKKKNGKGKGKKNQRKQS